MDYNINSRISWWLICLKLIVLCPFAIGKWSEGPAQSNKWTHQGDEGPGANIYPEEAEKESEAVSCPECLKIIIFLPAMFEFLNLNLFII